MVVLNVNPILCSRWLVRTRILARSVLHYLHLQLRQSVQNCWKKQNGRYKQRVDFMSRTTTGWHPTSLAQEYHTSQQVSKYVSAFGSDLKQITTAGASVVFQLMRSHRAFNFKIYVSSPIIYTSPVALQDDFYISGLGRGLLGFKFHDMGLSPHLRVIRMGHLRNADYSTVIHIGKDIYRQQIQVSAVSCSSENPPLKGSTASPAIV